MSMAPSNLDDNGHNNVDWSHVQTSEQSHIQPLPFTQLDSFENDNSELPNFSPFGSTGTEDFLQYIFPSPQDAMMPLSPSQNLSGIATEANPPQDVADLDKGPSQAADPSPPALLQLNAMLHENSARYKQRIREKGINSVFFDACISLFFSQFNPTFPIMHEATWKLKSTGPFLLLNMVAIGSLFLGNSDAISKGELLWEIAQAAASTQWNYSYELTLRHVAGDYPNTQIVGCALLGQVYAMMSKSAKLRHMAQTLHGWALSWARTLGMFDLTLRGLEGLPDRAQTTQAKHAAWQQWADVEMQRRIVCGLFVVDAQLARYARGVPLGRHVSNPLHCIASDAIFTASTPEAWISQMEEALEDTPTFREIFLTLFRTRSACTLPQLSPFSTLVLLEGFQALISESNAAGAGTVGTPSQLEIIDALGHIQQSCLARLGDTIDAVELRIRWHTLCIDAITDSVQLFRNICNTSQKIFCIGQGLPGTRSDIKSWTRSAEARAALLHANTIQHLAQRLHLGRAHALSMPAAVFASATIYYAFFGLGDHEIRIPARYECKDVHAYMFSKARALDTQAAQKSSTLHDYLLGRPVKSDYRTVNLRQGLYQCQIILRTMASQWGIAKDMLDILVSWTSTTRTSDIE
ncbi:uncharacterized protein PV06_01063 [Exophiala oligosperma]|uniref:Xylanolytic transcriptional activator regulatory domain-containing protein n=1 Tax=Exophiala oligosperma TaxID=215243 RepID=A0A0D2DZF9_9EURO|nr:uncharacterized protein PV06_01063 [Exophiala oligosperma]KIW48483.1 hypothetical protein PV06_01063 [Exophiala oligosperma]